MTTWQPMSTAPRDPKVEILATDYDCVEIIHSARSGWEDRYGEGFIPSLWQPLPDVPPAMAEKGQDQDPTADERDALV